MYPIPGQRDLSFMRFYVVWRPGCHLIACVMTCIPFRHQNKTAGYTANSSGLRDMELEGEWKHALHSHPRFSVDREDLEFKSPNKIETDSTMELPELVALQCHLIGMHCELYSIFRILGVKTWNWKVNWSTSCVFIQESQCWSWTGKTSQQN